MLRHLAFVIVLVAFTSMGSEARSAAMAITASGFSGSETLIDFEGQGFANGDAITNQYLLSGVLFSGDFTADLVNNSLLPPAGDLVSAGNTQPSPFGTATMDFLATQNRLGFDVVTHPDDDMTLELQTSDGMGGFTTTATLSFATGLSASFVGVEDLMTGFDRVILSSVGTGDGAFALDNLRFETAEESVNQIPLPTAAPLLGGALAALIASGWRRRRAFAA